MVEPGGRPKIGAAVEDRIVQDREKLERDRTFLDRTAGRVLGLEAVRRPRAVFDVFNQAGGSLLAEGLAYSSLFAGLTGLLFAVGVLGYLVPAAADRQRLIDGLTGQLAPFAPIANDGLNSVAAHAGAFSIIGLAGLAWGASQFYGALDKAISLVFSRTPARGPFDRILRGFVSVLLLVGGLLSGIALSAVQDIVIGSSGSGAGWDASRSVSGVVFPLATAAVVVFVVGVVYRIVPNTKVPISVLLPPTLLAGLLLTALTELLVYITPLLAGALSLFGGVAVVFATLAWLHLAFQVLLIGASWTRVRLDDFEAGATAPAAVAAHS
jgi:membrane protein